MAYSLKFKFSCIFASGIETFIGQLQYKEVLRNRKLGMLSTKDLHIWQGSTTFQVRTGIAKFTLLVLVTILGNYLDYLKCLNLCGIYKYRYSEWKILEGKKSFFNNCFSNIELMQRFILHFHTSLLLFFPSPAPTSPVFLCSSSNPDFPPLTNLNFPFDQEGAFFAVLAWIVSPTSPYTCYSLDSQ